MRIRQEKVKYFLGQTVLLGLAVVLILGAVEGLLRLKNKPEQTDDLVITLANGLRLMRPNVDKVIMGGANAPIRVKTNAEGFASPEYPVAAATGTKRIAFLGNSFTKGFEVDYDKKFTSLVEQYLSQMSAEDTRYEVMNFAQGGYSIAEQLVLYSQYVKKYKPEVVLLVVYAGYDFPTNQRFLGEREYLLETDTGDISTAALYKAETTFNKQQESWRSRLVKSSESVRFLIRFVREQEPLYRLAIKAGLMHEPFTKDVGDFYSQIWSYMDERSEPHLEIMKFTADLAQKLGESVAADGGKFGFIFVPSHWQVDNKYIQQLVERGSYDRFLPNKILREQLGGAFPELDLSERVARAINGERSQIFVNDIGHFTAAGHRLAAEEIVAFLEQKKAVFGL